MGYVVLLFIASFIVFVFGMIKPAWVMLRHRGHVTVLAVIMLLACFPLAANTIESERKKYPYDSGRPKVEKAELPRASEEPKRQPRTAP
jgi:hypothetical protein